MYSIKNEEQLEKVGEVLANRGLPLGFLNSPGFNPCFEDTILVDFLKGIHSEAVKKVGKELGHTDKHRDLLSAVYLLTNTVCYVATVPKATEKDKFIAGKVSVSVGTLSTDILKNYLGSDEFQKKTSRIKNLIQGLSEHVSTGYLPFVNTTFNKGNSVKFPRKHPNFFDNEYMVLPVSVLYGYVKTLRKIMTSNIVVVNARKTEGVMREFVLTSDLKAVSKVYNDSEVLDMFSSLKASPKIFPSGTSNNFKLLDGLVNLNMLYYEIGVPAKDYPKRNLNLSRISSLSKYSSEEEQTTLIRKLQRYSDMDIDQVVSVVQDTVIEWTPEDMTNFMVDTLSMLKSSVGTSADTSIEIKGKLDFQMKFHQTVDRYSTSYIRTLVDYILQHPVEFNGFTGKKMSVATITDNVVQSESKGVEVDLTDLDLDFELEF